MCCRYDEFPQAEQAQQQLVHTMCVVPGSPAGSSSSSSMAPSLLGAGPSTDPALLWTCTGSGSAFIYKTEDSTLLRKVGSAG